MAKLKILPKSSPKKPEKVEILPLENRVALGRRGLDRAIERLRMLADLTQMIEFQPGDDCNPVAGAFGTLIDLVADDLARIHRGIAPHGEQVTHE